jgi:hypothetical protein
MAESTLPGYKEHEIARVGIDYGVRTSDFRVHG